MALLQYVARVAAPTASCVPWNDTVSPPSVPRPPDGVLSEKINGDEGAVKFETTAMVSGAAEQSKGTEGLHTVALSENVARTNLAENQNCP